MARLLSDDELRRKLELYGEKVGPVTPTTRRTLERKLDSLLNQRNRTLNALSSDESDMELLGSSERATNKKKRHNRTSHVTPIAQKLTNLNVTQREDIFKKPLPSPRHLSRSSLGSTIQGIKSSVQARRSLGDRKERSLDVEVSDSDVDTESLVNPMRTLKLRNRNSNHVMRNSGDGCLKRSQRPSSTTPNGDETARNIEQTNQDSKLHVPGTSYRLGSPPDRKYNKDCNANGFLMNDSLNGMFSKGSKSSRTTNYSIYVSWILVLVAVAFFIFLGIFYMSTVQKTQFSAAKTNLESLICENETLKNCIPSGYFKTVLMISHDLHNLLSTVAGNYECQHGKSRNISFSATETALQAKFSTYEVEKNVSFDKVMKYAVLLFVKNPDWGISVYSRNGKVLDEEFISSVEVSYVSALESKHASKSFWCRMKHSIQWTVSRLLLILMFLLAICLGFVSLRYWKMHKDQEEKEFYELVERILDVLQNSDEMVGSSYANSTLPSKAVVHLRDSIIPVKDRRAKQHLWDRAVAFIEENESRVQVDYEQIGGEDFKVWRWLPSPMSEIEEGKKGKVWQGQAFGNLSKGKNFVPYSPTPCLKIRNMFDSEVEYGDDWQVSIRDAILEKCEGNDGIVHIAVDVTSKEGCVYMLCDCPESAGKAYSALHGWWFDGKLVTVKYLRLERYLQRFPEAEDCDEPLKPSNNKRLSLSTPFFSSALERS